MKDEFNKQKEQECKLAQDKTSESNNSSSYRSDKDSELIREIKKATQQPSNTKNDDEVKTLNAAESVGGAQNNNVENSTNDISVYSEELCKNVERVLRTQQSTSDTESSQNKNNKVYKTKMGKLSESLKSYFELFKSSKQALDQVRSQKAAELNSITKVFQKCRQELDLREKLVKLEFNTIVASGEDALTEDIRHLSDKCSALCKQLEVFTKKSSNVAQKQSDSQLLQSISQLDKILMIEKIDGPRMNQMASFTKTCTGLNLPSLSYDLQKFRSSLQSVKLLKSDVSEHPSQSEFKSHLGGDDESKRVQSSSIAKSKSSGSNNYS